MFLANTLGTSLFANGNIKPLFSIENCFDKLKGFHVRGSRHGLGNRLLSSSAGYIRAKKECHCFLLYWEQNIGLPNKFEELFVNPTLLVSETGALEYSDPLNLYPIKKSSWIHLKKKWRKYRNSQSTSIYSVWKENYNLLKIKGINEKEYLLEIQDFMRRLKPSTEVLQKLNKISKKLKTKRYISVHIRTVNKKIEEKQYHALEKKFELSEFDDFVKKIEDLRSKEKMGEYFLHVASDNNAVKNYFKAIYRDKVVYLEAEPSRSSKGMIDAVAEWIIMRDSVIVVGTKMSTLSDSAAIANLSTRKIYAGLPHPFENIPGLRFDSKGYPFLDGLN